VFYDAATQDTRLVLANVLAAHHAGAVVATHTEVIGARDGALLLRDRIGGAEVEVKSQHVVNAAGPRADALRRRLQSAGPRSCAPAAAAT
jgi:glycerol-3-phosphate dehydrogenase